MSVEFEEEEEEEAQASGSLKQSALKSAGPGIRESQQVIGARSLWAGAGPWVWALRELL